ncbi:unnamed protein product [Cuscuta europaea]|uniref:ABC transporter family G domain-containing protein n=1 Tax=Cuscuta europaea TaxID=41803 RepID=A0A9P0ZBG1_CUSEU|nr:unnamed protein product [Cuscuta europaea]
MRCLWVFQVEKRKSVTTGVLIVGPRKTLFMDEISTGLDSSTTYHIVKCIRNCVHLMEGTILMALLQPAPETFDMFDDLVLLSEGYVVYHGPRDSVVEFFESLGFKLPPRKGIADFLQKVTSRKDPAQYWADHSKPYAFIPVSKIAEDIVRPWSLICQVLMKELVLIIQLSVLKGLQSLTGSSLEHVFPGNCFVLKDTDFFTLCQVAFVGFLTCTKFLRTRLHPTDLVNTNLGNEILPPSRKGWPNFLFWMSQKDLPFPFKVRNMWLKLILSPLHKFQPHSFYFINPHESQLWSTFSGRREYKTNNLLKKICNPLTRW